MSESGEVDEGLILQEGIELAKQCATALMMGDQNTVYDLLDAVEDPEVMHTAFIYATSQWSRAMEIFMGEGEWAQWLINKELQEYDDQG